MNYFDMIGEKLTKTGQDVMQKTKDTTEVLRLNGLVSDEQKRMAVLYEEIGRHYFELHADSCEPDFEKAITELKDAKAKIAEYSEQIKKLKHLVACPNCGEPIPEGVSFCTACGSHFDPASADQGNRCANCGRPLEPDAFFCTHCGTKVPSAASTEEKEPTPPAESAPAPTVCPNCGKPLSPQAGFCAECGHHLET